MSIIGSRTRAWLVDAGERVGLAAVLPFLSGLLATDAGWAHLSTLRSAAVAGVTAGLAALYSLLATLRQGTLSPASMMPAQQPGQAEQAAPPAPGRRVEPSQRVGRSDRLALLPASEGRKTGRLPKPDDPRDFMLRKYLTPALPKPPAHLAWDASVPGYGMLLNDRLGDCGPAGWLHGLQTMLAVAGRIWTPDDNQALDLYERVGGYRPGDANTDRGIVLRDLLKYVHANAVDGGQKIVAYAAINPKDHQLIKTAIDLFGFAYVGVSLTRDAFQSEGVHWHCTRGPGGQPNPSLGHCIIYTGYDRHGFRMVTWGQVGSVSYAMHDRICEEAWAVVSPDWMNATGKSPAGLDLAALERDLAAL